MQDIGFFRNLLHFLLTGPALIMLSLVQLWGYHVLAFKGKAACVHQIAGKATLGGPAVIPSVSHENGHDNDDSAKLLTHTLVLPGVHKSGSMQFLSQHVAN